MSDIATRRRELLERYLADAPEGGLDPHSTALWAIHHARLALGRELDKANAYFERVEHDPRPREWKDGLIDTVDWDFLGIRLLKTLLDFGGTGRLTPAAEGHLREMTVNWRQPRPTVNRNNDRAVRWPEIHTENHDLMCITLGLFREHLAGRPTDSIARALAQSLSWRFRRGWREWNSKVYQVHYLLPALILARHAPDERIRTAAGELIQVQMAERALLSMNGHLGGPFCRGYEPQFDSERNDFYLPVMRMAFGLGEAFGDLSREDAGNHRPAATALGRMHEGVAFAAEGFEPHPIVAALAEEAASRPLLDYRGTRFAPWLLERERVLIRYYNTPHVSMGSMRASGRGFQSRFLEVLFAESPDMHLRTDLRDTVTQTPWDTRNERGQAAQHANWLVSRGTLVAQGGLEPQRVGEWDLFAAGRGLCAHAELPGGWHLFQAGDLDQWTTDQAFIAALHRPELSDGHIRGRTTGGERVNVDLSDMSVKVNGRDEQWYNKLHNCPQMQADWEDGAVTVRASAGTLELSDAVLHPLLDGSQGGRP